MKRTLILSLVLLLLSGLAFADVGVRQNDSTVTGYYDVATNSTTAATTLIFKGSPTYTDGSNVIVDMTGLAATGGTIASAAITGSTLNSSKIGNSTPADATFTTIKVTGGNGITGRIGAVGTAQDATFSTVIATALNGTLGGTTPAAVSGTTGNFSSTLSGTQVTGSVGFTGKLGNVTPADASCSTIISTNVNGILGSTTAANAFYLTPITNIAATSDTLTTVGTYTAANSAVTPAKTGGMFVIGPLLGGPNLVGGITLSLPGTYSTTITGLTYTFTTATNTTLSVRTGSATDSVIYYGNSATVTKITSPASSGSTVTLVGDGSSVPGKWYVKSMGNGRTDNNGSNWTAGSF
jgi:hypothetical protein